MNKLKSMPVRAISALALASAIALAAPSTATADPTSPITPVAVSSYDSKIKNDGTNVYYPTNATGELPVALLLQGGKVHRQNYSDYAAEVASYGFIVVTPNHKRLNFFDLNYYTSASQIGETLTWMGDENANTSSPLHGLIDTDTMVLLGHSFGGATGLSIAEDKCSIPFCTTLTFDLPSAVKAGSFYGTNNAILGIYPTVDNQIPVQPSRVSPTAWLNRPRPRAPTTRSRTATSRSSASRVPTTTASPTARTPPGAQAETNTQSSTQSASIETTARWAALWLRAQLGDTAAANYVYTTGDAADTAVTVTSAP
ncbi:hypothetical protein [Aeromicrobium sp. UC242_57]|uniref:poly(ethylene terephthalate) hydrolase family protein n=1 Tax=Aeromicrobium sp. UC242_57 TaxID=3374624 RepID=UPI00378B4289